jgi:hypothetical protein
LATWTVARIEEPCSLKTAQVNGTVDHFDIQDAKTPAGWRQVPIHSKLKSVVRRLLRESKGG